MEAPMAIEAVLLIVFALALGGRDQWLIARWADSASMAQTG